MQTQINNSSQYLQKAITMKNSHISQLLQQLRKTQQLHSNLKKKYLADQHKLKQKMSQLQQIVQQLSAQNTQLLKKYRILQATMENAQAEHKRTKIECQKQAKSLRHTLQRLRMENHGLANINAELQKQLKIQIADKSIKQNKINQLCRQNKEMEAKYEQLNRKYIKKQQQLQKCCGQLNKLLKTAESNKNEKKRIVLTQIQEKIKNIMINI